MNATLYDPADVAFKPGDAGPRPMCAGCGQIEVGAYEPVCPECRKSLEHQCLSGSCFRLYQLLALVFPGAEPWYDHDHVITRIGGRFYDIRGEVLADDKWIPFTDQRAFNKAYLWGKTQP